MVSGQVSYQEIPEQGGMRIIAIFNIRTRRKLIKVENKYPLSMIRFSFLILITLLIISSCGSRRSKLDRKNLIPEKELVPILTDIYLADGLIGVPRLLNRYSLTDSISTYNSIIEKHGYTRATLDKSLKYYFIKDPKKLIRIYDKVLGNLSEMESRVQKEISNSKVQTESLWPGFDTYSFPDPSGTDSTVFNMFLKKPGFYALNFTVILYPDDQSLNPGLTAFTCHPDSIETGKRNFINPVYYIKDGHEHKYSVNFTVPLKTTLYVRGCLYDFVNHPEDWEKHLVIRNISLIYALVPK
jgi:hypothetical protein